MSASIPPTQAPRSLGTHCSGFGHLPETAPAAWLATGPRSRGSHLGGHRVVVVDSVVGTCHLAPSGRDHASNAES